MPARRTVDWIYPLALLPALPAPTGSLAALRKRAKGCRACPLWQHATQTVFGEGPSAAEMMLIGEQPGDQEDQQGEPFVGPAGSLLDRALAEVGLQRDQLYLTNAVKHFKFEPRGKRRLHQRASAREQAICRQWLAAELREVHPRRILALGAMASMAVFGGQFRLTARHGQWVALSGDVMAMATWHPSAVLRTPGADNRDKRYRELVADLKRFLAGKPEKD